MFRFMGDGYNMVGISRNWYFIVCNFELASFVYAFILNYKQYRRRQIPTRGQAILKESLMDKLTGRRPAGKRRTSGYAGERGEYENF